MTARRFGALILTHGRPDHVRTYKAMRNVGYTGPIWLVIDDEDASGPEYERRYPGEVITFSKAAYDGKVDPADNLDDRRGVVYARNASFDIAAELGLTHFLMLDDDYNGFYHRFDRDRKWGCWPARRMDVVFDEACNFLDNTPTLSVAFAQGGDYIGGVGNNVFDAIKMKRKVMNTFVCKTDRPFPFLGRVNEDTTTYVELGRRGGLFLSYMGLQIVQPATQKNVGGMTELYLDQGTYTKTFYSVLFSPSCVRVSLMGDKHMRLHHRIKWRNAVPKILREEHRKAAS